ncbi:MAG: U32 family peptidase [Clostridia bacterium]|nr:U32 family peptidase [Clostridia bacterium]
MNERKIELLAPAGNIDSFKAAVNAGADAVYMGLGKHNARVMAKNFTVQDYIECLDYAHVRGVKVYLTLNTLVEDKEIQDAIDMLISLYEHGLDAVILQDIGLASLIHKVLPELHMHASTQMSAYSLEQVKFLESLGFKRVVLARELTLEEIKYITSNTEVEIEAFIHGALCVSVSGQCLMSLAIGTRSANRGACAQPCRMKYSLNTSKGQVEPSTYILSKKDIYGLDILKDIVDSGIVSLKIEGRNKIPEYVALVISTYRKYLDRYLQTGKTDIDVQDEKNILQIFNRSGKSHGYLKGVQYKNSITTLTPKNTGLYLGKVIEQKGKLVKVKIEEDIDLHDGIEIYSDNNVSSTIVTCIKDNKQKLINNRVEKGSIIYFGDIKEKVKINSQIYKTSSYELNNNIQSRFLQKSIRKRDLVLNVTIKKDAPVTLSTIINNEMYTYNTNIIPEEAINKEITLEDLNVTFSKTQDFGIKFEKVVGYVQKGLFLRVSVLNEIRRNFVSKIESKFHIINDISNARKELKKNMELRDFKKGPKKALKNVLSIYSYDKEAKYDIDFERKYNEKVDRIDIQANDYIKNEDDIFHKYSRYNLGINISNFVLNNLDRYIVGNLERLLQKGLKTVILGSFRYIELVLELKKKYDFTLVADYTFNITNSYTAMFFKELGFDIIVPSFDTSNEQINLMDRYVEIELVEDYITVMTSRYCILGSFVAGRKDGEACSAPCTKEKYHLIDSYNEKYHIVCNNIDCTMKIVKKHKLDKNNLNRGIISIRNNIV